MTHSTFFFGLNDDPIAAFCEGYPLPLDNEAANAEAALTSEELAILDRMKSWSSIPVGSQDEALSDDLDRLIAGEEVQPAEPITLQLIECPDPEPLIERLPVESSAHTRAYDKLIARRAALEDEHATVEHLSPRFHEVMAELSVVNTKIETELERAVDDKWRKKRSTDHWRETEGREEYNARRRKVRSKPNLPKAETEGERKARNADYVWASRQRKKGRSEEEIQAALISRRAEREQVKHQPAV